MVALLLGGGDSDSAGVGLRPIELGSGYVWPEEPSSSLPEALGAAFAVEVLGWDEATVESDPGSDPTGPVWVKVSAPGREAIDILTAPQDGSGWVLYQIGVPSAVFAVVPGEPGATGIGLVQPSGATHAEVTVRLVPSDMEIVLAADADDLANGRVETSEIPDAQQVATVMVRYLDNNGDVITATGGNFHDGGPVEEPSGSNETPLAEGDCEITVPDAPGFIPPDGYPASPSIEGHLWYGTDDLWTLLPVDGSYTPRKSVWWSVNFPGGTWEGAPNITVTYEQLDGPARYTYDQGTNAYTPEDGDFMIAAIDPPDPGCWQVTATYKGTTVRYVYERAG
jgi:hypothetical protein